LAAGANADHHMRWRLRNLVVDPAAAAAFAHAWRHGQPAPRDDLTTHLRPTPRRALENSTRLALIHHHLRTQPPSRDEFRSAPHPNSPQLRAGRRAGAREAAGGGGEPGTVRGRSGRRCAAAGDAAYLRGDYGTAAEAYQEALECDPGDDAAWTGLALVCGVPGLRDRPEVVAAIYRALGGGGDVIALARWIFPGSAQVGAGETDE
jgi:tetratricopeptide (TPR) repeat protein